MPGHYHDLEAERYVIGAMLADASLRAEALGELAPKHFYSERHRHLFAAIADSEQHTGAINPRELTGAKEVKDLAREILLSVPPTMHYRQRRDALTECHRKQKADDFARILLQNLEDGSESEQVISEALSGFEALLTSGASVGAEHISTGAAEVMERAKAAASNQGIVGIRTGFGMIDTKLGGLQRGRNYIVGARAGVGKCLKAGTDVLTPNGPRPIEQLERGDVVYGYDGDGEVRETTVNAVVHQGRQQVVDLMHRGRTVASSTLNHRWLAGLPKRPSYVRETSWLRGTDKRVQRRFIDIPCGEEDEPHAYAIGAMLGDGCCKQWKAKRLYMSSENELIPQKVAGLLGVEARSQHASNHTWALTNVPPRVAGWHAEYWSYSDVNLAYREILDGKGAAEKTFPYKIVDQWNRESLLAFVAGLVDTDGSVSYQPASQKLRLSFSSNSRELIELFASCIYKLFQIKPSYTNGRGERSEQANAVISNTGNARRVLKALGPHLVTPRKQYQSWYEDLPVGNSTQALGCVHGEPYEADTWDIEVDNDTHLYVLANEGLVTHNSTFALAVAANVARQGYRVLVQSSEMPLTDYLERTARAMASITEERWESGQLGAKEFERLSKALSASGDLPIYVDGTPDPTPEQLRRNIARHKPDLVIVDYLQRMGLSPERRGRSEYEDVSRLSLDVDRLKQVADVPLLTVVQLNRNSEHRTGNKPTIADIRSSGQLEQDANVILLLHREAKYDESADPNRVDAYCVKNRHGQDMWRTKLWKAPGISHLSDDPSIAGVSHGA